MTENTGVNRLSSVIAGSTVMIALSILPVINFINLFFCSGIIIGGIFGVISLNKQMKHANTLLTYKDGALTGVLSGFLAAVTVSGINIISLVYSSVNPVSEALQVFGNYLNNMPPEMIDQLKQLESDFNTQGYSVMLILFTFISNLLIFPLFGAAGGLIASGIILKNKNSVTPDS
ncbi:MAG: hypothetical protein L0Y76_05935 [Ignavibacteria bacterium]|nr:hypothetical protein [Ignavibacteria bacterium]